MKCICEPVFTEAAKQNRSLQIYIMQEILIFHLHYFTVKLYFNSNTLLP